MNERIVVEHATKVQVANLAQSRTLKVTKPQGDQSIVLDLSDRNATFDLSAVADEKMTLVKVGPKLIILFDNQSTVTADPFFDFSGKPLANLDVELGAGRAINGEQFAQLFTITEDQSVLRAAGNNIPPSGADFHDVSIDPLPGGSRPLALLEQEGLGTRGSGVDDASSRHNIQTVSPKPVVTIPSPGGPTTTVFEAGLLASRGAGESAGTHAGQSSFPTTTKTGAINFNSPLADAGICQNGLRNRIIDRKPLSPNFSPPRGHERENRSDSKKLHSAASNESWFPHIVGNAEKSALNIIKYIVEMVNKWLTSRRGACGLLVSGLLANSARRTDVHQRVGGWTKRSRGYIEVEFHPQTVMAALSRGGRDKPGHDEGLYVLL